MTTNVSIENNGYSVSVLSKSGQRININAVNHTAKAVISLKGVQGSPGDSVDSLEPRILALENSSNTPHTDILDAIASLDSGIN